MTVDGRQEEIIATYQSLTKRAQHHKRLLSNFALRVLSLCEQYQKRNIQRQSHVALKQGDVVLLRNEGTACCLWKLAKIAELVYYWVEMVW